jgi:hypothetical protein
MTGYRNERARATPPNDESASFEQRQRVANGLAPDAEFFRKMRLARQTLEAAKFAHIDPARQFIG